MVDGILLPDHRIVQVDLKFPIKPIVSSGAKDLISQVFIFLYSILYLYINTKLPKSCFCEQKTDACEGLIRTFASTQTS